MKLDQSHTFEGIVKRVDDTQVTGNGFRYRYMVVENDHFYRNRSGELVNTINVTRFKAIGNMTEKFDDLKEGHVVVIQFVLKGRYWKESIFQDLEVIDVRIAGLDKRAQVPPVKDEAPIQSPELPISDTVNWDSEPYKGDLPF